LLPSKGRMRYQEKTLEGADALSLLPLVKKTALGNSVADVWHTLDLIHLIPIVGAHEIHGIITPLLFLKSHPFPIECLFISCIFANLAVGTK